MSEPADTWATASCAALLHQGRAVHRTALILSLPACAHALLHASLFSLLIALSAVIALALETYFAVRTGIDARLFDRLASADHANATSLADLDHGLALAGLAHPARERTLSERIAGARKLWHSQVIATLAVLLCALVALVHAVAA